MGPVKSNDAVPISIKLRVDSGCFCRNCCPEGHRLLDAYLKENQSDEFQIVEHESGPEVLTYINLGTAAISLAASVISLMVAIVQMRAAGMKKGDRRESAKIIVRRAAEEYEETVIMEIPAGCDIEKDKIVQALLGYAESSKKPIKRKNKKHRA